MSKGNVVASYVADPGEGMDRGVPPSPSKKSGNNVGNGSGNGSGNGNGNGSGSGSGSGSGGSICPSWRFDGLHITFDPRTFAVSVALATDTYACTFSSAHGCALTAGGADPALALRDKLTTARDLKRRDLSQDEHSSVRTGIASVMGQLDDVLGALKTHASSHATPPTHPHAPGHNRC